MFCVVFLCGFLGISAYLFITDSDTNQSDIAPPREAMVRITVYDDTKTKPVPDKATVFLRGFGYWPLKEELKYGSTSKSLGLKATNILFSGEDAILLYLDGETSGRKITVPFKMTDEMSETGKDQDVIHLEISDNQIKVVGFPIKAAIGKATMIFAR